MDEDDSTLRRQLQELVSQLLKHPDADNHPMWNKLKQEIELAISLDRDRKLYIAALRENF